jgi:BolA protein
MELENESHQHSGPAAESHFRLVLVSESFAGRRPVARHQMVYAELPDLFEGPLHALAMHLFTPEEWAQSGATAAASPPCMGGSKTGGAAS